MPESGIEDHEPLRDCLSELSARRAAVTRKMLEGDRTAPPKAREQGQNLVVRNAARLLERLQRTNNPDVLRPWTGRERTAHGRGTFNLTMSVVNPDPIYWTSLYVPVFIGPALLSADEVKPWHWWIRGFRG